MITAWIGSILFFAVAVLYVLLSFGLPYGDFALGGKHKILPRQMRVACILSVVVQVMGILVLIQTGHVISFGLPQSTGKWVCYFFSAYLIANTVMNALSKSKRERRVMTPLSLMTAVCFGLTAFNG